MDDRHRPPVRPGHPPPRPPWGVSAAPVPPPAVRAPPPVVPAPPDTSRRRRSWPVGVLVVALLAWFGGAAVLGLGRSEARWRAMAEGAAMYVALVRGVPVGLAAGVPRDSDDVKRLGAMWVCSGLAWSRRGHRARRRRCHLGDSGHAHKLSLWAPADDPRALRFYERRGFRRTGRSMPLPESIGGRCARCPCCLDESLRVSSPTQQLGADGGAFEHGR